MLLPERASSLERQSPRVTSCLVHNLCPREPSLQTTAVVSMGSADHQFNLAELLTQNYSLQEGCAEAPQCPEKPEEELDKDFIDQSFGDSRACCVSVLLTSLMVLMQSSDMPLDELLALYGYESSDPISEQESEGGDTAPALPDMTLDKEIMVGPQFQADLNILHLNRHCDKIYENEDQLLWSPSVLPEREVEEFLYRAVKRRWQEMAGPQIPEGEVVKDSEQALYELVKCNFNVEEALRRLRFNVKVIRDGLCAWSEEECRNFEHGFRVHGKNFHLIQANKVRTRSVGECVEYYYLWKKSERYDYFAQQTRLGRRKFVSSGTTDTEQDLDGLDPDGHARLQSEAGVPVEPLNVDIEAGGLDQPGVGSDDLPSSEPGPCPFQQLDDPPAAPSLQQPTSLATSAELPPTAAAPEPGTSPRLAVDLALPEELPLASSPVDLSEDTAEPMAPAQVALSVTEFGLIGIGDVNPFLTGHPACPASTLHSEPLSQCNVMTC
ncbi:mesoderm induction early response protein 2 isoform X10 [Mastomys coucha]|uniref:mesoderm induction early response protein 2 isoform X10 n=1 Tax=Mastomys coucha TaxID=35658 RepID=UPI001261AE16|nr:mesoderm induction early response protein 2 isoform X10 [Mastomys coucha]